MGKLTIIGDPARKHPAPAPPMAVASRPPGRTPPLTASLKTTRPVNMAGQTRGVTSHITGSTIPEKATSGSMINDRSFRNCPVPGTTTTTALERPRPQRPGPKHQRRSAVPFGTSSRLPSGRMLEISHTRHRLNLPKMQNHAPPANTGVGAHPTMIASHSRVLNTSASRSALALPSPP